MKTEKLKQNVKGYVHQFEDGGLRLLRKGQKGVIHAIFSRFGLVLILLLLQVGLLFSIFRWFGDLWPHYFGGSVVVTSAMVIYLLNSKMDNSAKITWMVVVAIAPVVGIPMFFYVKSNFGHNILRKRLLELEDQLRGWLPQSQKAVEQLKALEPGAASLAKYLYGRGGGFPVYQNTAMTYFPGGEAKFEELLRQLETAEEYIFVEYFIIDEGLMWGKILEVLARKALQGVDVRVMYDGTCEFSTLPRNYPRLLEKLNIQCKVFSPVQPFVSTHYNYRDHRKILVIDGRVGFTGGVNLADEYINHIQKHGRWKDAALMLEGEAVRSLTAQFLQMWGILKEPEYEQFLTRPIPVPENAKGVAAPYGDCPLDGERVGEMVYIDLLNRAKRYIHIMTPYLILDGELDLGDEEQKDIDEKPELMQFVKETLGDKIKEARASRRLKTHPVCMTAGEGLSFEMEKYFKNLQMPTPVKADRILELNTDHPAVQAMEAAMTSDRAKAELYAKILYDQALLIAGLPLEDPSEYTDLVAELMK